MPHSNPPLTHPTSSRRKVWCTAIFLALVVIPIATGLFRPGVEACSTCIVELAQLNLALFGYIMFAGFAISFTQPSQVEAMLGDSKNTEKPWLTYRERVQFNSFLAGLVFAGFSFLKSVNWNII